MKIENYEPKAMTNAATIPNSSLAKAGNSVVTSALQRFSKACLYKLQELTGRMIEQLTSEYGENVNPSIIRRAVQEANFVASATPFPALFLPMLAEEKVQLAYAWRERGRVVHTSDLGLAA